MSTSSQILEKFHADQRGGSFVDLDETATMLENDHGIDLPLGRLAIIGVRTAYGLDLTSEAERNRIRREVTRTARGLDISEDLE